MDVKHILVAQDFSKCSQNAVLYAVYLAKRLDAQLHQVHVNELHPDLADRPEGFKTTDREDLMKRLEEIAHGDLADGRAFNPYGLDVENDVVQSVSAGPAVLDYLEDRDIDLAVLGTHGRRGIRHMMLGSVAEEIVQRASCPVLTVGEGQLPWATDRILAPVDFSEHSREGLRHARELAALYEAKVDLLHVIEESLHPAFYTGGVKSVYDAHPDIEDRARDRMDEMWASVEGPDVEYEVHVRPGRAAEVINEVAEEQDDDLVVMATHGRTGLEKFFLGSVTNKVVRTSPSPVFTVRTLEIPEPETE